MKMMRKKLENSLISIVLILAMISSLLQTSNSMAKAEDSYLYSGEGY